MTQQDRECYRFGPFALEVKERELRRGDEVVPLSGKAFDLLLTLVRDAGQTVTKSQLMTSLWPDTAVEEGNLTQTVFVLRKALGEDAAGLTYIRTLPRQGYRFIAPVSVEGAPAEAETVPRPWPMYGAAFAILAVLAAGAVLVGMKRRPAPMTDRDVLVLADFTNSTGDPAYDGILRDALAYQLEQSPLLVILDDARMQQDLQLMRRPPEQHISNDLAREICLREADKAMLAGSIASLGKSYVIDLKTTQCESGATVAREHAEAADKDHVLQALARAAQGMRAKLGESLGSIENLAPPLRDWDVTTSSLEAFRAFHQGAQLYVTGHFSEAVSVLRRATELDPNLAFAWTFLAGAYYNAGGDSQRYNEYLDRAWALRNRVSAYERMQLGAGRNANLEETIQAADEFARTYPRNPGPQSILGRIHQTTGEFEKALANFQEVYRLYRQSYGPTGAIQVIGLIMSYGLLDRFDEAKGIAGEINAGDTSMVHTQLLWIAYAQADQESASRQIGWFAGRPDEHRVLAQEAAEARVRGQLRKSNALLKRAADLAQLRNLPDSVTTYLKPDPGGDALLGNCATARKSSEAGDPSLDRVNLAALVPANRIGDAVLALCGTPDLARIAEDRNRHWITGVYRSPAKVPVTRAAIAFGLGDPRKAIELLESVRQYESGYPMAIYIRGLAYLKLKKGAEAEAEFQKILDHRGANWGPLYPLSYVGLARGATMAGDAERARKAYENFFELWKDADAGVPILIQARKEYVNLAR